QAAEHDAGADLAHEMHGQAVKRQDLHVAYTLGHPFHQVHSLLNREERCFLRVDAYPHDQAIEDTAAAANDIQMTQVNRIENSGVDGRFHHDALSFAASISTRRSISSTL